MQTRNARAGFSAHIALAVAIVVAVPLLGACIPSVKNESNPPCNAKECIPIPLAQGIGLNQSIAVTWAPVDRAGSYNVYYSTTPGVVPVSIAPPLVQSAPDLARPATAVGGGTVPIRGAQGSSVVVPSLLNGTTYYAIVTAVDGVTNIEGLPSVQVSAIPVPSGSADVSFNGTGMVSSVVSAGGVDGSTLSDQGVAAVQDASGRIVSVGSSSDGSGLSRMAIWRFNIDGTPDLTFNGTGLVFSTFAAGGSSDLGRAVALDDQGRIVAAGVSIDAGGSGHLAIWRYNADGSPDLSFAGVGYALTVGAAPGATPPNNLDQPFDLKIDSQGRIVVLGDSLPISADPWFAIWRFMPDGSPDLTFSDGVCSTNGTFGGCVTEQGIVIPGNVEFGQGLAIDSLDRPVAAGISCANCGNPVAVVWRWNTDGTPDSTFGAASGGYVYALQSAGSTSGDSAFAMTLDGSGMIVVAGTATDSLGNTLMTVWRYATDGTLDPAFNAIGSCTAQLYNTPPAVTYGCYSDPTSAAGGAADQAEAVVIDGSGRLVIAGISDNGGGNFQAALWRLNSDGTLDTTFGGGSGAVLLPDPGGANVDSSHRMGLFLDALGRIVVVSNGTDTAGSQTLVVWRVVP